MGIGLKPLGDKGFSLFMRGGFGPRRPRCVAPGCAALGDITKARGMAEIAAGAGMGREALYKALRPGAQPRFDTIARVCTALGFKLTVQPVE